MAEDEQFSQHPTARQGVGGSRVRPRGPRRGARPAPRPRVLLPVPASSAGKSPVGRAVTAAVVRRDGGVARDGVHVVRELPGRLLHGVPPPRRGASGPDPAPGRLPVRGTGRLRAHRTPRPRRPGDRDARQLPAAARAVQVRRGPAGAHAAAPWLPVWDDHEVDNNYAGDIPEHAAETPDVPRAPRRGVPGVLREHAAAPDARSRADPDRSSTGGVRWGRLATFHMLDTRQFRDDQACGDGFNDCPAAADPARSLPGAAQEAWLADGFRAVGGQVGRDRAAGLLRPPRQRPRRRRRPCRWTPGTATRASRAPGHPELGRRGRAQPGGADRRRARALGVGDLRRLRSTRRRASSGRSSISQLDHLRRRRLRRADRHSSVGCVEPEPAGSGPTCAATCRRRSRPTR